MDISEFRKAMKAAEYRLAAALAASEEGSLTIRREWSGESPVATVLEVPWKYAWAVLNSLKARGLIEMECGYFGEWIAVPTLEGWQWALQSSTALGDERTG